MLGILNNSDFSFDFGMLRQFQGVNIQLILSYLHVAEIFRTEIMMDIFVSRWISACLFTKNIFWQYTARILHQSIKLLCVIQKWIKVKTKIINGLLASQYRQSNPIEQKLCLSYSIIQDFIYHMKFRQFLEDLAKISSNQISHFVIGNTSVDYDSFFGSILLAYILTATTGEWHQPIIDCKRQELGLRFQIEAILEKVQINSNILHFRESPQQAYQNGIYNLYDHNYREGINKIQYIVDHHAYSPDKIQASKYLIDNMGSSLTLLYYLLAPNKLNIVQTQYNSQNLAFPEKYKKFVKNQPFEMLTGLNLIDDDINEIIRYGILIDSYNFDPKMKDRWTIFDKMAVDFIEAEQKFDLGHKWLQSLKFDKERNKKMSLHQALVKDRKRYVYGEIKVDYSIIYLSPYQFYIHYRPEIDASFDVDRQQSDIYFLMSIYQANQGQFKRQIMYRIKNKQQQDMIQSALAKCFSLLNMIKYGRIEGYWHHWIDPSATLSRKKLEPLIKQAIEGLKVVEEV